MVSHPQTTKITKSQRQHKLCKRRAPTSLQPMRQTSYLDMRLAAGNDYLTGQAECLPALQKKFSTRKRMVVISGAGISVNAGIPDFRNCSSLFDFSVNILEQSYSNFHNMISDMRIRSSKAEPTEFHRLLDGFARNGRLLWNLTQNIDCLEDKLPSLSSKTVQMHGRLDTLVCQQCSIHTFRIAPEDFNAKIGSLCPDCETAELERAQKGKRSHGVGVLLPKVLLYGTSPDKPVIEARLERELFRKVDAVIIAGTRLRVKAAKTLAAELCKAAKCRNGLTMWVNKERPPRKIESLLDYVIIGDCDKLVPLIPA